MASEKQQILTSFFASLEKLESDDMMGMVEKHLSDEDVELFVQCAVGKDRQRFFGSLSCCKGSAVDRAG